MIELVKHHANSSKSDDLTRYLTELADLPVQPSDEVLFAQRERWLSLADETGREVERARQIGRQGDHDGAIAIFKRIAETGKLREADRISFGWELCHATQHVIKAGQGPSLAGAPIGKARRHISDYFKLGLAGPDLLHSRIAQQALTLAKAGHIKILPLARMWDLQSFRSEDDERFRTNDGKTLPALSESLVNFLAKDAAAHGTEADVEFALIHLEGVSKRFPDNQWLKMNHVKLLSRLGRVDDARSLAVEFVRAKSREFWAWELLGDLVEDRATQLACFAKALTCSSDDIFTSKIRLKFAEAVAELYPGEARAEVDRVIEASREAGHNVPKRAEELTHRGWYLQTSPQPVTPSFYDKLTGPADEYLLAQLPKQLAVIDHVNFKRKLFHYIVDKGVDGVAPFNMLREPPKEGQVVCVQVDTVKGPDGPRTSLLSIEQSDARIPCHLGRTFHEEVRVNNGMGFTADGIFIPPPVIAAGRVNDCDLVDGIALINFDRRKQRWGLKAIKVRCGSD